MKYIVAFLIGVVVFILCFSGCGNIINWMVSGVGEHSVRFLLKVILWVLFFGTIFRISYIIGVIVSTFVAEILERFD
jgi:Na+/H+ antiporter NhaC